MNIEDEQCPDYSVVSSSSITSPSSFGPTTVTFSPVSPQEFYYNQPMSLPSGVRRVNTVATNASGVRSRTDLKVAYTYTVLAPAGSAELKFVILVEPKPETRDEYKLSLSLKTGSIERALCEPTELRLAMDPRQLGFIVFLFPPAPSTPTNTRTCFRVWLRMSGVDHRIFADDELWVGRDPDFQSIPGATFARLIRVTSDEQIYQGLIGRALVTYSVKWKSLGNGTYHLSFGYEVGGVGRLFFDDYRVTFQCDASVVMFLIYAVPIESKPPGAAHRVRLWLRTPTVPNASHLTTPSYIYHRIWKSDDVRLGVQLDFDSLGSKVSRGAKDPATPRVVGTESTFYRSNSRMGLNKRQALTGPSDREHRYGELSRFDG